VSKIRRLVFTFPRLAIVTLTIIVLSYGAIAARPSASSDGQESASIHRRLEGTWRVDVTLRNCLTGEPVQAPFPALASFARGGTVTTADGGLSPAVRGTGLGTWWPVRGGAFSAISEAFLFNGSVRTGTQRITQEIEVAAGGEEFTANVASEIEDVNGNVIARGCATSIGRRQ
jgi:hypothetical protein